MLNRSKTNIVSISSAATIATRSNHVICCRSSPRARRNLTTRETTAATADARTIATPTLSSSGSSGRRNPRPIGFGMEYRSGSSKMFTGRKSSQIPLRIVPAAHVQITHRHRGVGGAPVGKRRNSIGIAYAITAGKAFASSPATSVPGRLATYGSR